MTCVAHYRPRPSGRIDPQSAFLANANSQAVEGRALGGGGGGSTEKGDTRVRMKCVQWLREAEWMRGHYGLAAV